jgi:hypothetical protein
VTQRFDSRKMWEYTGIKRSPFAQTPAPGQESVWDYPRPPMRVVGNGRPCGYSVYENPAQRKNPGTEGEITVAPKHGKVELKPPRVQYMPEAGYSGEDAFAVQMWTGGTKVVLLKFTIKVTVEPPN